MARPKLRSSDQSLPVRIVLGLYEFAASLKLAVVLIFSLAGILAWATFVDSEYGTPVVNFALYGSWWFGVLGGLLALNIFCAAVIRYPWKRHQTGFVITHLGLLVLIFGCLLSRRGGIDAQMAIVEDGTDYRAYSDDERLELAIERTSPGGSATNDETVDVISIPFRGGPFNWADLKRMRAFPRWNELRSRGQFSLSKAILAIPNWAAWNLAPIDEGVVYDRDGIRVEALDYYSNAQELNAPRLRLSMTTPTMPAMDAHGRPTQGTMRMVPIELAVGDATPSRPLGMGDRKRMGGGSLVFWMTDQPAQVAAFLDSAPDRDLGAGGKGQVVLHVGGRRFAVRVDDKLGQEAFPLGESGVRVKVVKHYAKGTPRWQPDGTLAVQEDEHVASNPVVELKVWRGEETPATMFLFADYPELDTQLPRLGVYGSYWIDSGEKSSEQLLAGQGGARIDILQSPDQTLYYRYWNRREVVAVAPLPTDGRLVDAFKMPIAQLKMKVDRYIPAGVPGKVILPVAFNKQNTPPQSFRAVKLRVTVDGQQDEFWLTGPSPYMAGLVQSQTHGVQGQGRRVTFSLPLDSVDVGFVIRLKDFERKLDPGTSQASHFSSTIDFLDAKTGQPVLKDVFITMNAPVDFSDPRNGRSYRLFQESFSGPFLPGDPLYENFYRGQGGQIARRPELYTSTLTVNYDPGRGVKYCGSLLIVAGIVTMFYMRAYFFKPGKPAARPARKRELVAA